MYGNVLLRLFVFEFKQMKIAMAKAKHCRIMDINLFKIHSHTFERPCSKPPHCREAAAVGSGTWPGLESTIKLSETKKVPQYCALQPMCRGSFVFLPRTFHPLRAKRQSGRQTYRLVRQ